MGTTPEMEGAMEPETGHRWLRDLLFFTKTVICQTLSGCSLKTAGRNTLQRIRPSISAVTTYLSDNEHTSHAR